MTSDEFTEQLDENLRKWFKEKWVRFGPDGKIRGACARGDDSEGKPKCLPQKKAQNLGKKGRKYAASKKRREDPNPERTGKAKNVATKKKTNEDIPFNECPSCRGPIVHESMMNEKQDACYHKVKSRYKVWPSAYASGALVQCRKKGASNWGNKKTESSIMKGIVDEAGSPAQQAAIAINMKKRGEKPKHVDEAKAKQYVKPYISPQTGEQIGWKSSDGYHVKYWQMFAKNSAIKHAKLNPDEVEEDYTGQFAAEKTPKINPYGGLKDHQHRGAIGEAGVKYIVRSMDGVERGYSDPNSIGAQNWKDSYQRKEKPFKPEKLKKPTLDQIWQKVEHAISNYFPDGDPTDYLNPYMQKTGINWDDITRAAKKNGYKDLWDYWNTLTQDIENDAYGDWLATDGKNVRTRGQFMEDELDEACWKGYHKEGNKKMFGKTYPNCVKNTNEEEQLDEKCWDSHKQVGMKNKGGRQVPNCVPKESSIMKGLKSL
jgi:hypothetical protein